MKRAGIGFGTAAIVVVAGMLVLQNLGAIDITWPWEKVDVLTEETTIAPAEAEIIEIEPISLDCRARVSAAVPVEGRREHKALGQVYRTDKVTITAIGDIDTCIDNELVEIIDDQETGEYRVLVPADAITFERPRVDAELTQDSVHFSKGWVGKVTDAFPWVSDNTGLTPAAYTFSQNVIGSSECMSEAFKVTRQLIVDAYEDEMVAQGLDRRDIEVRVIGEPSFGEPVTEAMEDFRFEVADEGTVCQVAPGAFDSGDETTAHERN